MVVPIIVLGIPVSETQLIYYQLQYTEFAYDGSHIEQLDLSSCLHFVSKIICLPEQDKAIYHSCFHDQTFCHARIENVYSIHDLVTQVGLNKVCVQVMSEKEKVVAFFSSCIHYENLTRGLYCLEGDLRAISMNLGRLNISSINTNQLKTLPIQFNLAQIDKFPWDKWTEEIKKDKGLLKILNEQVKEAEIAFNHHQGQLSELEPEWNTMSGTSWWGKFKKSVNMWTKSSAQTAVGNTLSHPIIIIIFIVISLCVIYQIFIMYKIRKTHRNIKEEINKGDNILKEMLKRTQYSNSILNTEPKIDQSTKCYNIVNE
ncbi:uncharacterized protein LOC122934726 [Bufo gargarizans]|uniref:uncharacterized protein LOC122934726 n=1 Tax=Bufo gargarizans TaxID=30331 RepID=UPI001CF2B877|nr:uncharacterized protein LOC122934726 [Bufo gargarizans]XP_044146327.1 uncharacterized protein LOC122934726 [Bufo gargarizans]XP_044146328.1 uncharacterized protein LOC122934726 [Bufo gargarizans]XP_044146329.1 uncharacterized protein LOC122934726 [Bufo gargarizans]